ncbi:unnamed protein product [Musa textilis]
MLLGDGRDATIVTGSKTVHDGITTTLRSATFAITGNGFIARDMTFENTAVPEKNQAVALRLGSDLSEFYRFHLRYCCTFKGYQGTLHVHSQRQFIYGTVDFIYGDVVAVPELQHLRPAANEEPEGHHDRPGTGRPQQKHGHINPLMRRHLQELLRDLPRPAMAKALEDVFMKTSLSSLVDPLGGSSGTEALR